jgi:uncharacterized membrane protein
MLKRVKSSIAVIIAGTLAWTVALVIALAVGASANAAWICVVGILLGLNGLRFMVKRYRREKN